MLKPLLGGVDGYLHFPELSMNRLNQNESVTFSIVVDFGVFIQGFRLSLHELTKLRVSMQ
jgi:hypothetical protein